MKIGFFVGIAARVGVVVSAAFFSVAVGAAPVAQRFPESCVLQLVAEKMSVKLSASIPAPKLYFASKTPIKQYQDAVEEQWHFRPEVFSNVYVISKNEIYLVDDERFYAAPKKFLDDSVAHELAHYIQVRYQRADLDNDGDVLEQEAVRVQSWFRDEVFMKQSPEKACASK